MKKKTRIIGSISALALSMAMLTGGVLAAGQVNLNVSSTVSFNAEGVYLKAEGQVKRGSQSGSTSNIEESERPDGDVGSYSYLDYSYDEDVDGTPLGNSSFKTMPNWTIGKIMFDETNKVIEYVFTFTNYSEFDIQVQITPTKDSNLTNVSENQTNNTIEVTANGGINTYTYTLTLKNFSSSFSGDVGFKISAERLILNKAPINVTTSGLGYDVIISINDVEYNLSDPEVINNTFLKKGDRIYLNYQGCAITLKLYNSKSVMTNSWNELNELNIVVPEVNQGDYFELKIRGGAGQ